MQVNAFLYREEVWGRSVWYVDCPSIPSCTPRRRIFLVVDTTDSFWPAQRQMIQNVFDTLAGILQSDDVCILWTMGESRLNAERPCDPSRQWHRVLFESLQPFDRGSWLTHTMAAISEMVSQSDTGWQDYLLIVTDGAIYDAFATTHPARIARKRVVMITPNDTDSEQRELGVWCSLRRTWAPGILDLLRHQPQDLWLEPISNPQKKGRALAVYCYDPPPIRLIGNHQEVVPGGNGIQLCYLDGDKPEPRLHAGNSVYGFHWSVVQNGRPGAAAAMSRVAKLLMAPWDTEVLNKLRTAGQGKVEHCGAFRQVDQRAPNDLTCPVCSGCVLVLDGKRPLKVKPSDASSVLLFPLPLLPLESGRLPEYRSPAEVGKGCYEVLREKDDYYLVLDFVPGSFGATHLVG